MRKLIALGCTLALFAGIGVLVAQDGMGGGNKQDGKQEIPPMPKPTKEHEHFKHYAGTWDYDMEMWMGPGEPTKSKGTEIATLLGGFWVLSDIKGKMPTGDDFTGHGVFGYNPEKKKYTGTWVDSMSSYQWTYEGTLDATGKILTYDATGPDCMDATKTAKYKDVTEWKDNDNKVYTSSVQGADGKWTMLMRGTAKRKK